MPNVNGISETALYVDSVNRSNRFYETIFNFEIMQSDERFAALNIKKGQVLLLFKKGGSVEATKTPGGIIPPSDGKGETHLAFSVTRSELDEWEKWLLENNIQIESRVRWDRVGESIYFRDPDNHSIELASPVIWPND